MSTPRYVTPEGMDMDDLAAEVLGQASSDALRLRQELKETHDRIASLEVMNGNLAALLRLVGHGGGGGGVGGGGGSGGGNGGEGGTEGAGGGDSCGDSYPWAPSLTGSQADAAAVRGLVAASPPGAAPVGLGRGRGGGDGGPLPMDVLEKENLLLREAVLRARCRNEDLAARRAAAEARALALEAENRKAAEAAAAAALGGELDGKSSLQW